MSNLNIIHSDWLIRMLKKSSNNPQTRLLNLFDILEDWLDAPYAQQSTASTSQIQPNSTLPTNRHLQDFLAIEAAKAGAALPEMLANQLYFMAVAAAQEKLQTNNQLSLSHAKNAASALIAAQTEKEFRIAKAPAYAIAASFLGALIVTGSLFIHNKTDLSSNQKIAQITPHTTINTNQLANPQQTAALLAQLDQMRKGNCQLIEAVQLPDSSKKYTLRMLS